MVIIRPFRMRTRLWLALAFVFGLFGALVVLSQPAPVTGAGDPVIAGAGDIACDPTSSSFNGGLGTASACHEKATSDLMLGMSLNGVFAVGDTQYENGAYDKFMQSYDPSWGRLKAITFPAVGNHEYLTTGASGYFTYFGAAAGDPTKGYYSYNLGAWHIVVLNSDCSYVACASGSAQEQWLKADLAGNEGKCMLAYFHHPRYSSGRWEDNLYTDPFWQDLYAAHADVVLNGHDHDYERFALQDPNGQATPLGIREFVVGMGGANHTPWTTIKPNSQVRNNDTYGVLKLTLHPASYDWQFVHEAGKTFTDSGSTACHNPTASAATPTPTTSSTTRSMTFTPTADAYVNSASPTANYGTATQLRVDASPIVRSYLRFDVQGITGAVTRATLRLYANSSLNTGYSSYRISSNTWGETTINYGNAPALGTVLGTTGTVISNTWTTFDVTPYVTGNGSWNFALASSNATALSLASREATNKPQLIIESASGSSPTPTRTVSAATPTNTATATSTKTPAPVTATPTRAATGTATPTSTSKTVVFTSAADSYVNQAYPDANYGSSTQIRVDGSPIVRSYLRFNVQGLSGTVAKALLRVYANSSSSSGYSARFVASTTWSESTITYNNAPAPSSTITGSSGAFGAGVWTTVDVTSLITGNGTYSLALTTTNSTATSLASRESGANAPQLVVTTK